MTDTDLRTLRERLAEISDLEGGRGARLGSAGVDAAAGDRGHGPNQLATLGRIAHERFTDPEIGRLLDRLAPLEESHPYDSFEASLVRVTRRDWEKQRRVPAELEEEMTRGCRERARTPGSRRAATATSPRSCRTSSATSS